MQISWTHALNLLGKFCVQVFSPQRARQACLCLTHLNLKSFVVRRRGKRCNSNLFVVKEEKLADHFHLEWNAFVSGRKLTFLSSCRRRQSSSNCTQNDKFVHEILPGRVEVFYISL